MNSHKRLVILLVHELAKLEPGRTRAFVATVLPHDAAIEELVSVVQALEHGLEVSLELSEPAPVDQHHNRSCTSTLSTTARLQETVT